MPEQQRPATLFRAGLLPGPVRRKLALAATVLSLAALLTPIAGAQVFFDLEDRRLVLVPGETTTTNVTLTNPANRSYTVQASPKGNLSHETQIEPRRFHLPPQGSADVSVTVDPPRDTPFRKGDLVLSLTLVDRSTGETTEQQTRIPMTLEPALLYLGAFENPLGPPYDTPTWLFALEIGTWLAIAALAALVTRTFVNVIAPRASLDAQSEMAGKIKWPGFFLPVILGLDYSWRLLPRDPVVVLFSSLLSALSVVILAIVGYRVLSAGLVYYGENIAEQTETKADDVLVPVLEKLGAAIIIAAGGFFSLKALGVDFSFLLAGGLVAGLVISMAAQDTLSNFFSGLHLLIDRPFREGDVIRMESGEVCRVEEIGLRSTELYHFQNHQVIIAPNNELATKLVVNMTYPDRRYRLTVPVGVAYDTDLEEAVKIIHNVAMDVDEVVKGRNTQPRVFVKEFGDSSITLELRAYVPDERDRNSALTKLHQDIKDAFDEADIEIPFPQRVLHMQGTAAGSASKGSDGSEDAQPTG